MNESFWDCVCVIMMNMPIYVCFFKYMQVMVADLQGVEINRLNVLLVRPRDSISLLDLLLSGSASSPVGDAIPRPALESSLLDPEGRASIGGGAPEDN